MEKRHKTHQVTIGGVKMGGDAPVVVQSMTNTDTADVTSTANQIAELYEAGSEIVRVTVNNDESAAAIPHIHEKLLAKGLNVPIVGDFHYNGHRLLEDHPACAEVLAKYRINPGNVGFGNKKDNQFAAIIERALEYDKPVRIGVNWGSLDQALATKLMDDNANSANPLPADAIMREALVQSALISAEFAEKIGMAENKIVISTKVSRVQDLIATYRLLATRSNYPLHLGLTEAGMGVKGMVGSTAALAVLLQEGIGDTIRVSLTPEPGAARAKEVQVAQEILQSMGLRAFVPQVTACPGCGRTTSTFFQELAQKVEGFLRDSMPKWREEYEGVEHLQVAVMGCIVNGPGESKHAHIGISLPGTGEDPAAPVFMDGKKVTTLRGGNIPEEFQSLILEYVESRYQRRAA